MNLSFLHYKTILVLLPLIFMASVANSQCTNGTAYGTMTAPTLGTTVTQGCTFATEYNTVNSVALATTYQSSSSIATDFLTVRQGTPGGAVIASGITPLNWTSTVAGTYYVHINTNAACGTASSCRTISLTHIIPTVPMTYTSSTATQPNTTDLDICATDAEIIRVEVVTTGSISPIDISQLRLRTNGSTAPIADITNIDVYYTGTDNNYSTANLYGSAAPAATGTNIQINGTQTLLEGTNYFWVTYDINGAATAGNNVDALCNRIVVDGTNRTPSTSAPAGSRTLIDCSRMCPTNANIFSDGFESGSAVTGVIPGTTYGTIWNGNPRTGTWHAWMNVQNGLSNLDIYERRFDGYYMGCDVTFDYWYWHNTVGFDAEYILVDDNNNIIDFNNVITTAADVNIYQNQVVTFTPTTTGITLRVHVNSTGGNGNDIAIDDFGISQCCAIPLPTELLFFDIKCENSAPSLNWSTASEINNDYFIIERSYDMEHFEELERISGHGNTSTQSNYTYTPTEQTKKPHYYRLKQVDFDGTVQILETVSMNCLTESTISIYPNPTKENFYINLGQIYEDINVEVKTLLGQIIHTKNYESIENVELSINNESGIYFVTIYNNQNQTIYHQKILKQ